MAKCDICKIHNEKDLPKDRYTDDIAIWTNEDLEDANINLNFQLNDSICEHCIDNIN